MERREVREGQFAPHDGDPRIFLLAEGEILLQSDGAPIEIVLPGDFWGEATVVADTPSACDAVALSDSVFFSVPAASLTEYPSVFLKLMEAFDRRMKVLKTRFRFEWQEFYAVGVEEIDSQHKELFEKINELSAQGIRGVRGASRDLTRSVLEFVRLHFAREEALLETGGYPRMEEQRVEHGRLLGELKALVGTGDTGFRGGKSSASFFKSWLIKHTLVENRAFREFLAGTTGVRKSQRG
jgi:hemerythrin